MKTIQARSREYCCRVCHFGTPITVVLFDDGEASSIIPADRCDQCGAGKPFFYAAELGRQSPNLPTARKIYRGGQ